MQDYCDHLVKHIRHVSAEQGDGLGYDILSFNHDGSLRFIEVKSTTVSLDAPFYISQREMEHLERNQDNSFLYHVFIEDSHSSEGSVRVYTAKDVLAFHMTATQYRVMPRAGESGRD